MFDYTIAAIPTLYKGRRYRSRLEARWAAFFDLCDLRHEYEPCDLGTWSPDFAVWFKRPKDPVLVEVKPITVWDRQTAQKMADALDRTEAAGEGLLLGSSVMGRSQKEVGRPSQIGWVCQPGSDYEWTWGEAVFGVTGEGLFDVAPRDCNEPSALCWLSLFHQRADDFEERDPVPLWIEAANAVQWRAPR